MSFRLDTNIGSHHMRGAAGLTHCHGERGLCCWANALVGAEWMEKARSLLAPDGAIENSPAFQRWG